MQAGRRREPLGSGLENDRIPFRFRYFGVNGKILCFDALRQLVFTKCWQFWSKLLCFRAEKYNISFRLFSRKRNISFGRSLIRISSNNMEYEEEINFPSSRSGPRGGAAERSGIGRAARLQ